jgi:lactoylglutathione lyase
MKLGAFSVSLNVKDIHVENCIIGLFQGMFDKNILTFNPGWNESAENLESFTDVREIQKQLKEKGVTMLSEADESTEGPAHFIIEDPDGNQILFDQHR